MLIPLQSRDGPGPVEPGPPPVIITGSESDSTMAVSGLCIALAVVSVGLRFWTRIFTRQGIKADDWMMLAAVVTTLLTAALLLWGNAVNPVGLYVSENTDPNYRYTDQDHFYLQLAFATSVLYFLIACTTKLGILLMYHRIFSISDAFRYQLWLTSFLVVAYWIGCTVATLTNCIPLEWSWLNSLADPRYCFNYNIFWMASGACEIFLDVLVLSLPISVLLRMRLSFRDKLTTTGIFLLGGFVIITGIVRVILGYPQGSRVPSYHNTEVWATVHTGMAIVCASLPIFKPLGRRIRSAFYRRFLPGREIPSRARVTRTPNFSSLFKSSQASAEGSNPTTEPLSSGQQRSQPPVVVDQLPLQLPEPAAVHDVSFMRTWQMGLQERGYTLWAARDSGGDIHRFSR